MVKVFTLDENGKISFTKEELEKILEEVEKEAFERGRVSAINHQPLPYYNYYGITNPVIDKSHWEDQNWWKDPTCQDYTSGTKLPQNHTVVTC